MKTIIKTLFAATLVLIATLAQAQSCSGKAEKYKLDTIESSPNWSVVSLQLPNGAHLDSIYGGFQRPGYTGNSLSFSCYSQGTTNDTNLVNSAATNYDPYTGPYGEWISMKAHNVIGKSNSLIQFSITTANGMVMDSVIIAYSCSSCQGITKKYTLDFIGSGATWSYTNLALPDGALLDSVYGGIQRPGYSGTSLSYSCYSDSASSNINLLNTTTNIYNPYTGPYNAWIDVRSYNVIGKTNSFVQFSITQTDGMIFDSAMIAYSCIAPTSVPIITYKQNEINVYPNPASNLLHIMNNGKQLTDISITDLTGRKVYYSKNITSIDISGLQNGIYILLLKDNKDNLYTNKFIKE